MRSSRRRWHLDEVFVKIRSETHYLWPAVDHEGEVLECYVTKTRDRAAEELVTDKLPSYGAAAQQARINPASE